MRAGVVVDALACAEYLAVPSSMSLSIALLSQLFDNLPLGIVVLDSQGRVVIYNRAEEQLANRRRERVLGREFFVDVAPCMNVRQLGGEFSACIGRSSLDVNVEFSFPFPFLDEPRDVRVKMSSFEVSSDPHAFLMIEDVSAQRSVDRMKETLSNLLVHDLKNPLSAVLANLSFLEDFEAIRDNQDAREAIADSIVASQRLQGMLVNLLDITRLETSTLPLRRTDHDVAALLAGVVEGNAALARMHGSTLTLEISEAIDASLDPAVMRRALDNLVENALRSAKHVVLSARRDREHVTLEVRDDGPGIPEPLRLAIFEKYAQVTQGGATSAYNRGLGLTFVRLAARAHGGDVSVDCPASGGSSFRITWPSAIRVHGVAP